MNKTTNVGEKVKKYRERMELNQDQIAEFLSVDQSTISKCEKGERQFNIDSLEKLSNLFGCKMNDLLNSEDEIKSLNLAFRAKAIENEDLTVISEINRITQNILEMKNMAEG
jgi:transcriptional regulator with XRE-family HTH domain